MSQPCALRRIRSLPMTTPSMMANGTSHHGNWLRYRAHQKIDVSLNELGQESKDSTPGGHSADRKILK